MITDFSQKKAGYNSKALPLDKPFRKKEQGYYLSEYPEFPDKPVSSRFVHIYSCEFCQYPHIALLWHGTLSAVQNPDKLRIRHRPLQRQLLQSHWTHRRKNFSARFPDFDSSTYRMCCRVFRADSVHDRLFRTNCTECTYWYLSQDAETLPNFLSFGCRISDRPVHSFRIRCSPLLYIKTDFPCSQSFNAFSR